MNGALWDATTTQDSRADLAIYSPPIGPWGFATVESYANVCAFARAHLGPGSPRWKARLAILRGGSGRGTTRAEDAQGTPTQSHISPSILVYED